MLQQARQQRESVVLVARHERAERERRKLDARMRADPPPQPPQRPAIAGQPTSNFTRICNERPFSPGNPPAVQQRAPRVQQPSPKTEHHYSAAASAPAQQPPPHRGAGAHITFANVAHPERSPRGVLKQHRAFADTPYRLDEPHLPRGGLGHQHATAHVLRLDDSALPVGPIGVALDALPAKYRSTAPRGFPQRGAPGGGAPPAAPAGRGGAPLLLPPSSDRASLDAVLLERIRGIEARRRPAPNLPPPPPARPQPRRRRRRRRTRRAFEAQPAPARGTGGW
jgi:hypothetical protein